MADMVMKAQDMFICVLVFGYSSELSFFLSRFAKLQALCTRGERGTQVCVITSVIRPGYGPPASK